MMRLAFSLGSELPLHASPTPGGVGRGFSDQCRTWLWCLLALTLLGLPWCVYAKPEAESSASIDEVVTTIYHLDTLAAMKRQVDLQLLFGKLHKVQWEQGKEDGLKLHAELLALTDKILEKMEWVLDHGTERKSQLKARFLALPAPGRSAIEKCFTPTIRFDLQDVDLARARHHPPASQQGMADRIALIKKHAATANKLLHQATCHSPELEEATRRVRAPRSEEPSSQIDAMMREERELFDRALQLLRPFMK